MAKKPAREPDDYPLLHPGQLVIDRLDAYYSVLSSDDATYDAELRALFELLRPGLLSYGEPTGPDADARAVLEDFVERWNLPRFCGAPDIWNSFILSLDYPDRPLRLVPTNHVLSGISFDGRGYPFGLIQPKLFEPFVYDPTAMSLKTLHGLADEIAREVRQDILAQAEKYRDIALSYGHRPIPPRHRNWDHLRRMARRVYLAAVPGRRWAEIAAEEAERFGEYCDPQSVRSTVRDWAETLDVRLPRQKIGRPRKGETG
jgi:hypothetical protein